MSDDKDLRIELVPWDFDSREHTVRMHLQRVGCGWRSDEVEDWSSAAGLAPRAYTGQCCGMDSQISTIQRQAISNVETAPICDTAATQWQRSRTPSHRSMKPIGHVALDLRPDEDQRLGLPSKDEVIVWVAGLYISYELQGIGLGREVMEQVELLAREQPLMATCVVLETMPREQYLTSLLIRRAYEARGRPMPTFAVQDWYERQGYVGFLKEDTGYQFRDPVTGEKEDIQNLIMWKRIKSEGPSWPPHAKENEVEEGTAS